MTFDEREEFMGIMDNEGHDPMGLGNTARPTDELRAARAEIEKLRAALEPFAALGGPNDGVMPAYYDIPDDIVIYKNSGQCITAGDVRAVRAALGMLHAHWKIPSCDEQK